MKKFLKDELETSNLTVVLGIEIDDNVNYEEYNKTLKDWTHLRE